MKQDIYLQMINAKRQNKKMSIKFGVSDLLGQYSKFYQNNQQRVLIKTNNEQTINLTINYKL